MIVDRFNTVQDIADLLKIAPTTVRNLIKNGELRGFQVGHRGEFRIEAQAFEEYIQAAYHNAVDEPKNDNETP